MEWLYAKNVLDVLEGLSDDGRNDEHKKRTEDDHHVII